MGFSYTGPLQPCLTRGEKLADRLHWMFILCHWMRGGQNEKGGHAYMCVRATLVCVQSWNFTARPVRLAALSTRCVIWASCPGLPTVIRSHYVLWTTDYIQPEPHQLTDIHGSHCGKEKDDRKAQWRPHSPRQWNLKKKRMEQLGILAIVFPSLSPFHTINTSFSKILPISLFIFHLLFRLGSGFPKHPKMCFCLKTWLFRRKVTNFFCVDEGGGPPLKENS